MCEHLSGAARRLLDRWAEEAAAGEPVWLELGADETGHPDPDRWTSVGDPVGHTAAAGVAAIGVVGTGRLRLLDPATECPAHLRSGLGGGLRMACVMDRHERIGWIMELPDGTIGLDAPEEGRVLDTMRRNLGLATPPPGVDPAVVAGMAWLSGLARAGTGRRLSWPEALCLHPDPDGDQEMTWDTLRRAVAAAPDESWVCSRAEARWMDAGIFARTSMALLPTVEDLLERARPHLQPAAARRVAHMVRACA